MADTRAHARSINRCGFRLATAGASTSFATVWGTRRDFLRVGSGLAVASYFAPGLARAGTGDLTRKPARSCILIYLLGGPPTQDMWDLKPESPAEVRGPFRPIVTNVSGIRICEHLPRLARMAERYALVRSVSRNNHNHTPMIYYTLTGRNVEQPNLDNDVRPPQRHDDPHLGAVLANFRKAPDGLAGYIAIPELAVRSSSGTEFKRAKTLLRGGGAGFLGATLDPLGVNGDPGTGAAVPALTRPADVTDERLQHRAELLALLDRDGPMSLGTSAHSLLRDRALSLTGASGGTSRIFSLDGEPTALREQYGMHRFGRAALLARRLAEAGVPMIAIHFNEMTLCDGWDTHAKNFEALQGELLPTIDQTVSALLTDLAARGILDETLVVMMGEFGRTPKINKDAGRDHWGHCQTVFLAGGGIRGGQVIGASDKQAAYVVSHPIDPTDIQATIYHAMGLSAEQTMHDQFGRPLPITTGHFLPALLE